VAQISKRPVLWPGQAAGFDDDRLALVLLTLPADTSRPTARRLVRQRLRQILSGLMALPVEALSLVEGPHGPLLNDTARDIRISLSYAGDRVLIGLAEGHALGVDVVRIERLPGLDALSRLYLPDSACRAMLDAAPAAQDAAFALGWAQMEASCKCLGLPLMEIDAQRARALATCQLVACRQMDGYRMAVALSADGAPYPAGTR
jgi:phosphopantetheinyl transferase